MPAPFDTYSFYGPGGALNTEQQIGGLDLPGREGGGLFLGGLGDALGGHITNSLALKQQAALAGMARDQRMLALQEQQAAAEMAAQQRAQAFAERQYGQDRSDRLAEQGRLADQERQQRQYAALKNVGHGGGVRGAMTGLDALDHQAGDNMNIMNQRMIDRGNRVRTAYGIQSGDVRGGSYNAGPASWRPEAAQQDPFANESAAARTSRLRTAAGWYPSK